MSDNVSKITGELESSFKVAARLLRANRYMTMATCRAEVPWATPLAYVIDEKLRFIFYSARDSRHCQNLAAHSACSVAIFNSTEPSAVVDGLQFSGFVAEVGETELDEVMQLYFTRSFPDPAERKNWLRPSGDFRGNAPQRFYRIMPSEMYTLDPASTKVDRRRPVDMDKLRKVLGEQ